MAKDILSETDAPPPVQKYGREYLPSENRTPVASDFNLGAFNEIRSEGSRKDIKLNEESKRKPYQSELNDKIEDSTTASEQNIGLKENPRRRQSNVFLHRRNSRAKPPKINRQNTHQIPTTNSSHHINPQNGQNVQNSNFGNVKNTQFQTKNSEPLTAAKILSKQNILKRGQSLRSGYGYFYKNNVSTLPLKSILYLLLHIAHDQEPQCGDRQIHS